MAVEKLEVILEAKADGFKRDVNEAKLKLNELEIASLKAGGGTKKMAKQIKLAKVEVKTMRLEYERATLELKKNASQAIKTTAATKKLTTSQKKSRQAMTQIAYAMDDMQYGFQGVQNNIQAMAVSMGAGGPLIIGITAVVAGIGFMVNAFKKSQKEAIKLKEELSEKQGLMAKMMTLVEVVKQNKKGTEAYEEAMKKLRQNGFRGANKDLDDYIKRLRLLMIVEAQIAAKQGKMKTLAVDREEAIQTMKDLDKIAGNIGIGEDNKLIQGKVEGGTGFLSAANVRKYNAALKAVADTTKEMGEIAKETGKLQADLFNDEITKNKNDKGKSLKELKDEIAEVDQMVEDILVKGQPLLAQEFLDFQNKIFSKGGDWEDPGEFDPDNVKFIDLDSIDLDEETQRYLANLKLMIDETKNLRDTVGGAFSDLGSTIAANLGANGDAMSAFLGAAIGTYTKLLASNKDFLAKLIPLKATESGVNAVTSATETASKIPYGAFALPALIAGGLAAVSSAFSSVGASSGGGGGGGSRASGGSQRAAQATFFQQSGGVSGRRVAIRGQELVYINQASADSRRGLT